MKKFSRSVRGFTLVEMMVIVAIIAILAAIAYPSYIEYIYKSRLEQARVVVLDNVKMMERYYGLARSFECKSQFATQMNATCKDAVLQVATPDAKVSNINDYYDFKIKEGNNSNNYIITATPKADKYSENALENHKLYLTYDSLTSSYSKCTKSGATQSKDGTATTVTGCEVL